jgi:hypothetical protein
MKTLIFALIFSSFASAQPAQPEVRLSDAEINNKLIGVARDIENERILEGIPDFQRCKQQFAFKTVETTDAMRQRSAQDATKCFEDAIKNKNSLQEIAAISDKLNLEAYKLIPSKTVQEVTKYLSNKMYKSLTGIDYEETDVKKRIESLKFNKNKKIVDQKQFIILYKNQIAKNVMTEVSRFCLEDFRVKTPPSNDSFEAHWKKYLDDGPSGNFQPAVSGTGAPGVTDQGSPFTNFDAASASRDDKDAAYGKIVNATFPGDIPASDKLSAFFFFCGGQINELCSSFEARVSASGSAATVTDKTGSRACLTKSRLVSYKKALKASDLIIDDFDKNGGGNAFRLLDNPSELVKAYGSGKDKNEKSLNEISNNSSIDFFAATENEDTQQAEACARNGTAADCDEFVIVDDSRIKIQYNLEIQYTAKREAEIARVRKLKAGDQQSLLEYLKTNGYLAAAEAIEKNTQPQPNLEELVGQAWEAKKIALQEEIQKRLGKRQITENEAQAKTNGTDENRVAYAKDNAQEALNERARLSRVIFFNNIISSNLELVQSGKVIGRNTQALSGEVNALDGQINASIFQNLRDSLPADTSGGGQNRGPTGREDVSDVSFLDQFLGGAPKPQTRGQGQTQGGRGLND